MYMRNVAKCENKLKLNVKIDYKCERLTLNVKNRLNVQNNFTLNVKLKSDSI